MSLQIIENHVCLTDIYFAVLRGCTIPRMYMTIEMFFRVAKALDQGVLRVICQVNSFLSWCSLEILRVAFV